MSSEQILMISQLKDPFGIMYGFHNRIFPMQDRSKQTLAGTGAQLCLPKDCLGI